MKVVRAEDIEDIPLFGNVSGKVIFSSERVMFLLVKIEPREIVPEHSHPHEQMGICLKGRAEFSSGEESRIVEEGTFYWIKPGEKHSVKPLGDETCIFLDVFNPPREDYLEKLKRKE